MQEFKMKRDETKKNDRRINGFA